LGGLRDGIARRHHHPARESADAVRNRRAVAGNHVHIIEVDAEIIGADLSERGLLSLSLRRRALENAYLAVGPDFDAAAFVGAEPRPFDVGGNADTQSNTLLPQPHLQLAEIFVTDYFQRLLQAGRIIAAVVFQRIVVAVENPNAIGIFISLNKISAPDFGWIDIEFPRDAVHDFFHHIGGLRSARAAHDHSRDFVGI